MQGLQEVHLFLPSADLFKRRFFTMANTKALVRQQNYFVGRIYIWRAWADHPEKPHEEQFWCKEISDSQECTQNLNTLPVRFEWFFRLQCWSNIQLFWRINFVWRKVLTTETIEAWERWPQDTFTIDFGRNFGARSTGSTSLSNKLNHLQ